MLKKRLGIEGIEKEWPNDNEELMEYFKISSTLIIPEGCEKIGDYAFWGCYKLKEVVISESVMEIGHKAFYDCGDLREVVIPENVVMIGVGAFCYCYKATIILRKPRKEFKEIGDGAFGRCKDVKEKIRG